MKESKIILDKTDKRIEICNLIKEKYPSVYLESDTLPQAFHGTIIHAIVLGADPGNVAYNKKFKYVFGLEKRKSPYFITTKNNLRKLSLHLDNIYVQNVIQNYFKVETSKNKYWYDCALLWLDYLRDELDERFGRELPVYVTSWEVLKALIGKDAIKSYTPKSIYSTYKFFSKEENYLGRKVACLFRHPEYSLDNYQWREYWIQLLIKFSTPGIGYFYNKGEYKSVVEIINESLS